MSGSQVPLETHFFDQYVFLDFTIPNLFHVKGKIGAYENFLQTVRARLTTQTAVVTGGGSGIGTMISSAYVQNGAKVYIASRKEGQLKEVGWPQPLHSLMPGMTGLTEILTSTVNQVSEKLNKIGPGSCEYVVADLSVSPHNTVALFR